MIDKIVLKLADLFPEVGFGIDVLKLGDGREKYQILVNDYDFYMKDPNFKKWRKILENKYPSVEWFCAFKSKID